MYGFHTGTAFAVSAFNILLAQARGVGPTMLWKKLTVLRRRGTLLLIRPKLSASHLPGGAVRGERWQQGIVAGSGTVQGQIP